MTTEADRIAYNERRRSLRASGIVTIPDLYNMDDEEDRFTSMADPTGHLASVRRLERSDPYDVETDRQVEALSRQIRGLD